MTDGGTTYRASFWSSERYDDLFAYWRKAGLCERTARGLASPRINAEVMAKFTDADILRVPGLGRKALKEIRTIIPSLQPPFKPNELIEVAVLMEVTATRLRRIATLQSQKEETP